MKISPFLKSFIDYYKNNLEVSSEHGHTFKTVLKNENDFEDCSICGIRAAFVNGKIRYVEEFNFGLIKDVDHIFICNERVIKNIIE